MHLRQDMFRVFNSNLVNLIIGVIIGFLIPAFLSIDQYAYLKTFNLYLIFVGILHFGFIDGIFLKYGGKNRKNIDIQKLKGEHKFLIILQLVITILAVLLGYIMNNPILIAFSFAVLPLNIQTLYKFMYQALGEFKSYSKIIVISPNIMLIFNLLIIFVLKWDNFWPFVIFNIFTYYLVFIGLEISFFRKYKNIPASIDFRELGAYFKVGFFIMLGNFASLIFFNMDRWFVKQALTTSDFAFYSFALSMMTTINTLMSSVALAFYPYLANKKQKDDLGIYKTYLIIIGVFASGSYFFFDFIVNTFIGKYTASLEIISVLFAGFPAIIVINTLYINLYKVNKEERRYVTTVIIILIISVILNFISILIYKNNVFIASMTTVSYYIWYFYSAKYFLIKSGKRELIYLLLYLGTFLLTIDYLDWGLGLFVYYFFMSLFTITFYRKEIYTLIKSKKN